MKRLLLALAIISFVVTSLLFSKRLYNEALFIRAVYFYKESEAERAKCGPPFVAGNKIIQAINEYSTQYGKLPNTLQELVPKFIPDIPEPGWGINKWDYYVFKDNEYELSVLLHHRYYTGHYYSKGRWYFDN